MHPQETQYVAYIWKFSIYDHINNKTQLFRKWFITNLELNAPYQLKYQIQNYCVNGKVAKKKRRSRFQAENGL